MSSPCDPLTHSPSPCLNTGTEEHAEFANVPHTDRCLLVCPQFDSVADVSDVSSNVTLKSYTMHFEVALVLHECMAFCMVCWLPSVSRNTLLIGLANGRALMFSSARLFILGPHQTPGPNQSALCS